MTDLHTEGEARVFVADPLAGLTGGHTVLGKLEVTTTAEVITCADKLAAVRRYLEHRESDGVPRDLDRYELLALTDGESTLMARWGPPAEGNDA